MKARPWFYLLVGVWLLDYARRRWAYRQLYQQTRAVFQRVTRADIVARELEDAQPLEMLLQARTPAARWYYLRRYALLQRALQKTMFHTEDWLLDVGCGDGYLLKEIAHHVIWNPARMVGVDLSFRNLELVGARFANAIPRVVADAEQLPFRSNCFRAVLCTEVLEHTLQPAWMSAELTRVCAPRGQLYLSTPSKHPLAFSFFNPLTWLEAVLSLAMPAVLPPFHDVERPHAPQSVIHRAFTRQELQKLFRQFSVRQLTSYHFRLSTMGWRGLNPVRLEPILARWPLLNRLGLTLILVAQK